MVYLGAKTKYCKEIIPIIQEIIDNFKPTAYIEPFVGGANVIDKIKHPIRIGADKSATLIALLNKAKSDFDSIPSQGNRDWWDKAKAIYRGESNEKMESWKIGAIQYLGSFSARGFPGGYASPSEKRNPYNERYHNLQKQVPHLKDIKFVCCPYTELRSITNALVYCDPPYEGTKEYQYASEGKFNHEEYWNWVRKLSENNYVICSEQNFPEDFEIIWEKQVKRTVGKDNNYKATERLGVYKQGLLGRGL